MSAIERALVGNAGAFVSPLNGSIGTIDRSGDRWRISFGVQNDQDNATLQERAAKIALIGLVRNRNNRLLLNDPAHVLQGAFLAPELLTNGDFASGTTGWSVTGGTITVSNRVLRLIANAGGSQPRVSQSVSLTQYVTYILRSMILDGAQSPGVSVGPAFNDNVIAVDDYQTVRGLRRVAITDEGTASFSQYPAIFPTTTGYAAGAYVSIPWCSLSRCLLVDNGPNALTKSDEFDHANWAKAKCTITVNAGIDPYGTATADRLSEDNTSGAHTVAQAFTASSAAADFCICVALQGISRTFAYLQLSEATGGTTLIQYFNLGAGTVGSTTGTGANWSKLRAFILNLGSGWSMCCLIGRKTNSSTSITATIGAATADGTASYLGTSVDAIGMWRATAAQSSVPTRLVQTTTAATAGTPQTGSALYVKGGRTPSEGALANALVPGQFVQVGNQLLLTTAPLDLDASGCGYWQFSPKLITPPADNAPIIINKPMGKYLLTGEEMAFNTKQALFSDFQFDLIEDPR